MKVGMKIPLEVGRGMMLLGMATPFTWADEGTACKDEHAFGMARHDIFHHGGMTPCPAQPTYESMGSRPHRRLSHQTEGTCF